jgi:troponin T
MSDDEYYEEETKSNTSKKGDEAFAKAKAGIKKSELDEQLREYINEWRKQRVKEEEELKRLKEKQAKRKEIRAEQEKKIQIQKKEEEEKVRKEENEKKAKEAEEKKKRMEEAESKRQAMLEAQKEAGGKKQSGGAGGAGGVTDARKEMSKTKEQLNEEMKMALSIKIKPLELDGLDSDEMKKKAEELFHIIVQLETDKYDYEQRKVTQDYELKELKERQKVQLRQKALKKGLDPEALTGKHPPKIRMYSKYERRTDTRTYEDRKKLYEGGWEVIRAEALEAMWKEKYEEWTKRPKARLPKWFGERPGKKNGDAETPEDEEGAEAPPPMEEEEEAQVQIIGITTV